MTPSELEALWNSQTLLQIAITEHKNALSLLEPRLAALRATQPVPPGVQQRSDGAVRIPGIDKVIAEAAKGDIVDRAWAERCTPWWFTAEAAATATTPEAKARITLNTAQATMMNGLLGGKGVWPAYDIVPVGDSYKISDVAILDASATMADMAREDGTVVSHNFRIDTAEEAARGWLAHFRLTSGPAIRYAAGIRK